MLLSSGQTRWLVRRVTVFVSVILAVALSAVAPAGASPAKVAEPRVECPVEVAGVGAASSVAAACGGLVRVGSKTDEFTEVFAKPDGSFRAEVSSGHARVRNAAGGWDEVDLSLERRADGSVAARTHPVGLVLSGARSDGQHHLAALGVGEQSVGLGWRGRLPEPVLSGTKATYVDVRPGIDLVVESLRYGFETFLIVKNRAAAAQVAEVAMPLATGSLSARARDGGLDLVDSAGKVRGQVAEAFMWDARVNPDTGEPERKVPLGVSSRAALAGVTDMVLTPGAHFLADPSTVYPVTIDPITTLYVVNDNHDTWVQCTRNYAGGPCYNSGSGWDSTELKLGTFDGGITIARSFLWFPHWNFYGATVTSATLQLWETWAYSCRPAEWQLWTSEYFDHMTVWSNQPPWSAYRHSSWQTTGYNACSNDGWVYINATDHFQVAADGYYAYYTIGLKAGNEALHDSWKRFHSTQGTNEPRVVVDYHYPATVGAMSTSPSMPCVTGSGRPHVSSIPSLQAQVSDPEGHQVQAQFEWWVAGGSLIGSTVTGWAGSGSTLSAAPPAAGLPDGGTFAWRAQGFDGARWGPWSAWCEFTVDSQAPTQLATSPPMPCMSTATSGDTGSLPRVNPSTSGLALRARVDDVNGGNTQAQFEWWPKATRGTSAMVGSVTTPTPPGLLAGSTFTASPAPGGFTNGVAYSWRVRGHDGGFVKPWSPWCEFVVDTTAPVAPGVSAAPGNDLQLVPAGGATPPLPWDTAVVGRPTRVTFTPAGGTDPNVVGYLWGLNTPTPNKWAPAGPDGTAVVTVMVEPLSGGFEINELSILAVDRAGNRSALPVGQSYSYGFKAHDAAGWWPTTGSGGPIQDATAADNDLTLTGGASLGYGVLSLDGTDDASSTTGPVLDTTDSYTVAAWVRPTSLSGYRVAVSLNGSTDTAFRLQYRPTENRFCMVLSESDTAAPAEYTVCAASAPASGVWTHLTGVYDVDSSEMSLYVDGALAGSLSVPTVWPASGSLEVGRRLSGSMTQYFAGDIADVRAWQRVLDPTGIANLATLPPAAGAWGMDDTVASAAPDVSGLTASHPASVAGPAGWLAPGHAGAALVTDGAKGWASPIRARGSHRCVVHRVYVGAGASAAVGVGQCGGAGGHIVELLRRRHRSE